MKLITFLSVAFALALAVSGEHQQKILKRVIKSTPTATSLGRIRTVTVRSASSENGAVAEISSKEAASFGQRSPNETQNTSETSSQINKHLSVKTKQTTTTSSPTPTSTTTTTTTTSTSTTSTTASPTTTTTTTSRPDSLKHKASDRQQAAEVELLSSAPSSWQTMTAVEAPAAMLIATGVRTANSASATSNDLTQSSSNLHLSEDSSNSNGGDVLRSSATKGSSSYTQQDSVGEQTFSRIRQQSTKQQTFFYPQPAPIRAGKTNTQATKTHWYQPPSTTPKPAPIIQQEQQQYEQQNEQYVEQQAEYNAAPLGQAEPFAFDFNTKDSSGNGQYRKEESDKNGVVKGSYGYTDANGIYRHVEYVADQNGFRANIKSNEPGLIGETQPASIQLASGPGSSPARLFNNNQDSGDNGQWNSVSNNDGSSADLALAPPDFESSHKSDRIREPRHFRN